MCKIEIFQFIHEIILQCVSENGMGLSRSGTVGKTWNQRTTGSSLLPISSLFTIIAYKENVIQDKMYGRYLVHIQ